MFKALTDLWKRLTATPAPPASQPAPADPAATTSGQEEPPSIHRAKTVEISRPIPPQPSESTPTPASPPQPQIQSRPSPPAASPDPSVKAPDRQGTEQQITDPHQPKLSSSAENIGSIGAQQTHNTSIRSIGAHQTHTASIGSIGSHQTHTASIGSIASTQNHAPKLNRIESMRKSRFL